MASELEQQLGQLDELLGLLDASALRSAQEALEYQIAELSERLEVTRQALTQAQSQRRRLARARLLLEESAHETNSNGDPAFRPVSSPAVPQPAETPPEPPTATAPFVAERRQIEERRENGERRQSNDRRKNPRLPSSAQ
ncbi:MAG: hypothetical protein ABSB96_02170 [Gaiellaceae bacterium]